MGLDNSREFLAVLLKWDKTFEGKLNICLGKQELPELHSACVSEKEKTRTVLKLAVDSINLGLCDFRNYFVRPSLIEQTKIIVLFLRKKAVY